MKMINYTLPEFCFLDGNSPAGDTLLGRTVIQHIRTYSIIEAVALEEVFESNFTVATHEFNYLNNWGKTERFLFALHFTLADASNIPEIFALCQQWYCAYMTWEDQNIIIDQQSKLQ